MLPIFRIFMIMLASVAFSGCEMLTGGFAKNYQENYDNKLAAELVCAEKSIITVTNGDTVVKAPGANACNPLPNPVHEGEIYIRAVGPVAQVLSTTINSVYNYKENKDDNDTREKLSDDETERTGIIFSTFTDTLDTLTTQNNDLLDRFIAELQDDEEEDDMLDDDGDDDDMLDDDDGMM